LHANYRFGVKSSNKTPTNNRAYFIHFGLEDRRPAAGLPYRFCKMRTAVFAAGLLAVGLQGAAAFSPAAIAQVRAALARGRPEARARTPLALPRTRTPTLRAGP